MNINAIAALAYRDFMKLIRDPVRLISSLIFPLIFIGIMGGSFESGFGSSIEYDFVHFVFVGVLAQTLFQSSALGIISLIEDRQSDFMQEIFVSPISRHSIVFGKIIGESMVAMVQGVAILAFGFLIGVPLSIGVLLAIIVACIVVCFFGGSFGVLVLSSLNTQRAANQIFPFIMLPQIFLSGVFAPIVNLPLPLDILSRISPMRYAVDLVRGIYYYELGDFSSVVVSVPETNFVIISAMFIVFVSVGTLIFVRKEKAS